MSKYDPKTFRNKPLAEKKAYIDSLPAYESVKIVKQIKEITDSTNLLTEFEVNFLQEFNRLASRFYMVRMSFKQKRTLDDLWTKYVLKKSIEEKRGPEDITHLIKDL